MDSVAPRSPSESSAGTPPVWCLACRAVLDGGTRCPRCGLPQTGADIDALRVIDRRLHEVNARLNELSDERVALSAEGTNLLNERSTRLQAIRAAQTQAVRHEAASAPLRAGAAVGAARPLPPPPIETRPLPPPPSGAGPTRPPAGRPEVRPVTMRTVLLALGVTLLACAAVVFVAVTWPRLGATGRAATLGAITLIALGVSLALRRRLPATAEAIAGLFLAFVLIDWQALHTAGADASLDPFAWWAMGTTCAAALAWALAVTARFGVARFGTALLAPAAAVLTLAWLVHDASHAGWLFAIGGAALATVMLVVAGLLDDDDRSAWRPAAVALTLEAILLWIVAGLTALGAADVDTGANALFSGLALASAGLPPVAARVLFPERVGAEGGHLLVGVATVTFLFGAIVATAGTAHGQALVAASAWLTVLVVLVARTVSPARGGAGVVGCGALILCALNSVVALAIAISAPTRWLGAAWTGDPSANAATHLEPNGTVTIGGGWSLLVVLGAVIAATVVASTPVLRSPRLLHSHVADFIVASAALSAAVLLPLAAGASIVVTMLLGLVTVAALIALTLSLERRSVPWWPRALVLVAIALVPVAGWASVDRWLTVTALATLCVLAIATAILTRTALMVDAASGVAAALLIGETAAVTAAFGAEAAPVGFAVVLAGAVVLVVGWHVWHDAVVGWVVQGVGALGIAAGLLLPTDANVRHLSWWLVASVGVTGLAAVGARIRRTEPIACCVLSSVAALAVISGVGLAVATAIGRSPAIGFAVTTAAAVVFLATTWLWRDRLEARTAQTVAALGAATGWLLTISWWNDGGRWWAVATTAAITLAAAASLPAEPREDLRSVLASATAAGAITMIGLAASAGGGTRLAVALAFAVPAGFVLFVGAYALADRGEGPPLEVVGVIGLFGALAAANADASLVSGPTRGSAAVHDQLIASAAVLTVGVPAFALAGIHGSRLAYRWVAAGVAVGAIWLFLEAAHVDLVEAYTLPAAALALAAGYLNRHTSAGSNSWLAYGPGLAIALGPSQVLAVDHGPAARALILLAAGAGLVLVGVWHRLQAPLVFGSATLVALAVDTFGPVAARLPRWVFLAIAGVAFIWLGATIERRLRDLRHARDAFGHLH